MLLSQRRELNPRPSPYHGDVLPLNYAGAKISVGAVGVEPTGPLRTTVLQTDPTPYGTTHPLD